MNKLQATTIADLTKDYDFTVEFDLVKDPADNAVFLIVYNLVYRIGLDGHIAYYRAGSQESEMVRGITYYRTGSQESSMHRITPHEIVVYRGSAWDIHRIRHNDGSWTATATLLSEKPEGGPKSTIMHSYTLGVSEVEENPLNWVRQYVDANFKD